MDLNEYAKANAEFLRPIDVIEHPECLFNIKDEGSMVENKFGNQRVHLKGEFDGEDKIFDLSSTNARIISSIFGTESQDWVEKSITLSTYKMQKDGKLIDAIAVNEIQ
tara:strand:- start:670 stop:993 length:324 start_codon:yes stop_codon:yes gene_type:complete